MSQSSDPTRRDVFRTAAAAAASAASAGVGSASFQSKESVQFASIGVGNRGGGLLRVASGVPTGRCVAVCDIYQPHLDRAITTAGNHPKGYLDHRELLNQKDVEAVIIATPPHQHFPLIRDALLAGKHVFCEKVLVFKPEEVRELRRLAAERKKQVIQVGLQRRYSQFYRTARQMVDKGLLGKVTHINGQWNRNPGSGIGWLMEIDPKRGRESAWRLFREYSAGMMAERGCHQLDAADWIIGDHPDYVIGIGGNEFFHDGRTVYDNIQVIFHYPKGQKMMYQSINTNGHLSLFRGAKSDFGEVILGTAGTIEITLGPPAAGMWFYEPPPSVSPLMETVVAGPNPLERMKRLPILIPNNMVSGSVERDMKWAHLWLERNGIMAPIEETSPERAQFEDFFACCLTGKRPAADVDIGLANSVMVMQANLAMDEGRRAYFNEV
jgi:predicted dehydrogenase